MVKQFYGWIDERDLKKVRTRKKGRNSFPKRSLFIYDKHWYDGHCHKVKVTVLKEKK